MSRSEPSSKNKRGPEKPSPAAPGTKGVSAGQREGDVVRSSGRIVLIATLALVAGAAAAGLAFLLPIGFGGNPARGADTAAFVGSEACAGCHRSEAELWRGSQH